MTTIANTERCHLDATGESDLDLLISLHTDPEVRRYLGGISTAKAARRQLGHMTRDASRTAFTVVLRQTGEKIGIIDFSPHHDGAHLEVSYMILSQHWGTGLAAEALRKAIDHQFINDSALDLVVAETQVANAPSCRLLERLGFRPLRHLERFGAAQILYAAYR